MFLNTSPAHNVGVGNATNAVVIALNQAASSVMTAAGVHVIDIYTPIMQQCGPVPFRDEGPTACSLCAPDCKNLAVHYTVTGYQFFAKHIMGELKALGYL